MSEIKRIPEIPKQDIQQQAIFGSIESQAFSEKRDLEQESKLNDHKRKEGIRDIVFWAVQISIGIITLILIAGVIIWSFHMLAPDKWHWLTEIQIRDLQKAMSSSLLTLIASEGARKFF
ncbi:MAG: hypothetical protein E6Q61_09440 [Nitrosomonas sp.]|nr:MAG: hypothetical protein E6Q61_09440 [Nitrosomonas sp.]